MSSVSIVTGLPADYLVCSVCDKVTDGTEEMGFRIYACEIAEGRPVKVLSDWEFLLVLNGVSPSAAVPGGGVVRAFPKSLFDDCEAAVLERVRSDEFAPKLPAVAFVGALLK